MGGTNNYLYTPNPISWIDPLGLACKELSWDTNTQRWRDDQGRFHKRSKVATDPNTAYFWSGRTNGLGGQHVAADVAKENGGTTLEMLLEDRQIKMPEWDPNNPSSIRKWENISTEYAENVSGTVTGVVGKDLRAGNIWENKELPALKTNSAVTGINVIDPSTRAKTKVQ